MTKRIFRSIFLVALGVLLACLIVITGVLYGYFNDAQRVQLRTQTDFLARSVELQGLDYFADLHPRGYRITWIDPAGSVLYDSSADAKTMESHADRTEFKQALETGYGESARLSKTLTEKLLYAAKRLPDGTVLRVASTQYSLLSYTVLMQQPIALILLALAIVSGLLASSLSHKIVKPLNALNLDEPLSNETYEELAPLLSRIAHQHRQIDEQLQTLSRKQAEFAVITDSMCEGLILLNADGGILSINASAARLLSAQQDAVGRDMLSINRSPAMREVLEKAGGGSHAQAILKLGSGEYQLAASPVPPEGPPTGIVLLLYDITEKTQSELLRREFTANVSHELKTPLHSISGCAEILQNGLVKPGDAPQFLNQIYTETQRLITLVDDIIRLSRLDEGADELPRELVDLRPLAEETASRLLDCAKQAQIELRVTGTHAKVFGIPRLLGEMIYNLCDNAIKYNRPGGQVSILISESAQGVVLTVRDTGIGIPPAHQKRVFERFYRVDKSHSKEIGGTGLGLSIVKHAAALHSAAMELTSTPNVGTTITVTFPTAK